MLELVRRDALAAVIPALPIPAVTDLRALPVGRREDGEPFTIRLHGTHLLIAGATGAGKGSYLWGLVRAMLPAMAAGLVRVHACDPKLMELAFGRAMFERFGKYAADPADIAALLEADVADMQARAARFAGRQRDHTPTAADPFVVVLVDEVAFLTAYQADRKLKERILAALATLTTQGRAVGYCVVAALQDPRKEVLNIRNLFPDKIALRLDEPTQVDLVLGDGAHDRGALCEDISADPATGAGVGYVRLETDPDPVRVRAAFVTDDDIHAMTACIRSPRRGAMTTGWLSPEDCPDCGGPLLDTSTMSEFLLLECPGCGYRTRWHTTDPDDHPARRRPNDPTDHQSTTAGHAAGPQRGARAGRQPRRVRAPGPATPHRPADRPDRTRARPVRAHPRRGLPVLRRAQPGAAGGAVPGGLAPRPRAHRPGRRARRRTAHMDRTARRRPSASTTRPRRPGRTRPRMTR